MLERWFQLGDAGTTPTREALAGLTTFLTMAYIVVVNPAILADAGLDPGAAFVATCLAAALGSALMGLGANLPVALAPGMGLNAYFTYGVVVGDGVAWPTALGAVFLAGLAFLALSLTPFRAWLVHSIPEGLQLAVSAGVGLFLGAIGLRNAGVITGSEATLVTLGDLSQPTTLLALGGFVLIVGLAARGIAGAVSAGILLVTAIGVAAGLSPFAGVLAPPPSLAPTFGALDVRAALDLALVPVILSFLFVDLFDTTGTLLGVVHQGDLRDDDGRIPHLGRALLADSGATTVGAVLGTSPTTSYIESAAGIAAGGRTGLTAVVVAVLFLLALPFAPLAQTVPAYATAPALLFVAALMARTLADLDWDDVTEAAPAVVTALAIPLTYSIAHGIGLGFTTYALGKAVAGRGREVPAAIWAIAAAAALKLGGEALMRLWIA